MTDRKLSKGWNTAVGVFSAVLLLALSFVVYKHYSLTVSGTVVYGETGEPVEGAVVLAEWNSKKGIGFTHHEVVKIEEVATGKDGRFYISAPLKVSYRKPYVVVYKPGYVAWRNDHIFPLWEKRKKFKLSRNVKVELEEFKEGYSRNQHHGFMNIGLMGTNSNSTPIYSKFESIELGLAIEEIKLEKNKGITTE